MIFHYKSILRYLVGSIILFLIFCLYESVPGWSDDFYAETRKIAPLILTTTGSLGGLFLWKHAKGMRSKKIYAIILLMLALAAGATMTYTYFNPQHIQRSSVSPFIVLYGGTYALLMGIYPIEVLRPNWLTVQKICTATIPTMLLVACTYLYTHFCRDIEKFASWPDFFTEIGTLEMVIRLGICIYPIGVWLYMHHLMKEYRKWSENNYVVSENMDVEWLKDYFVGYLIILLSYVYQVAADAPRSGPIHGSLFTIFSWVFYRKVFFHQSAYKEGYVEDIDETEKMEEPPIKHGESHHYKEVLLKWFEEEKPFLKKEFRLMDLSERIPMNRTYLSRLINEEFETNFNQFITEYRLKESKVLLETNHEMTIKSISEHCGFSSPSVFTRSFINAYKVTPSSFRADFKIKK